MERRAPSGQRRGAPLFAFAVLLLLCSAALSVHADARSAPAAPLAAARRARQADDPLPALQGFLAAGRLDRRVLDDVTAGGAADAIVVLDEDAVSARLAGAGTGDTSGGSDARAVGTRAAAYAALKHQIAAALPEAVPLLEDFTSFGAFRARIASVGALLAALRQPGIAAITANETYETEQSGPANPKPPLSLDLALVGQPQAVAAGFTGAGASVAVIDTGVDYRREAFGACRAPGQPAATCRVADLVHIAPDDGKLDSDDQGLHGTSVAGIVAAAAPGARLLALDIFGEYGATASLALRALDWVMAHQQQYNIVAVNLSLGAYYVYRTRPCASSPYAGVFAQLRRAGIVPVVASGNDAMNGSASGFTDGIGYPACAPGAVSVGATYVANIGLYDGSCRDASTQTDQVACFSQSGPDLSLLAPGARITAAGVTDSGTSQAAPHVAAAVADLASRCRSATADQIVEALTNAGPLVPDARNGVTRHRLDIAAAGQALIDAGGLCGGS